MDRLSEREIHLIEELGLAKHLIDIYKLIETALVVRCGGEVVLSHAELEHTRQQYHLVENIQLENYQADITLRARLT